MSITAWLVRRRRRHHGIRTEFDFRHGARRRRIRRSTDPSTSRLFNFTPVLDVHREYLKYTKIFLHVFKRYIFVADELILTRLSEKGLSLTIGTLIMEQLTGVYAELAFLDVALNFGQALIAFAIFGLDPGLGRVGVWMKTKCRNWREGNFIYHEYLYRRLST